MKVVAGVVLLLVLLTNPAMAKDGMCGGCHLPAGEVLGKEDSALCLGCHDGSVAPGIFSGGAMIGLGGEHPVGVTYRAGYGYRTPMKARLVAGKVECETCHDVHSDLPNLLVMSNAGSALCVDCHIK